jgi:short-subunit dehydrogenase
MKTALITGASSGLGEAFTEELARGQYNLVIVARSEDKLQQLKSHLEAQHPITVDVIVEDLSLPQASQNIFKHITEKGLKIDLLINNAGFGDYGPFSDRPLDKQVKMIQLNITALVELTHLFLPGMKQRHSGGIINVSSIAGYQPLPYLSVYAATKAFVLSFSEALWAENKGTGVHILALCPGPTESKFFEVAEFPPSFTSKNGNGSLTSASEVAKDALKALAKNQANLVTGGLGNQVIVNLPRFFPRETLISAVETQFRLD